MSEVTEQGTGRFSISTLKGEPIVDAERPHKDKATLTSIQGTHFLVKKKQKLFSGTEATEQLIPGAHLQAVKSALYRHEDVAMNNLFDSRVSVEEERLKTFTNLLLRAEVQLIDEAAKAMGTSGISGKDNQAARVFYVYAMRLATAQEKLLIREVSVQRSHYKDNLNFTQALFAGDSVHENSNANKLEQCTTFPVKCPRGKCPIGKFCSGMCGPSCKQCWTWYVCGDCCYHQGCYDHDMCCSGPNGYMTWSCLAVLFWFHCDHYEC